MFMSVFFKTTVQQVLITLHRLEPFFEIFLDSNSAKWETSEAEEVGKVGARH